MIDKKEIVIAKVVREIPQKDRKRIANYMRGIGGLSGEDYFKYKDCIKKFELTMGYDTRKED